MLIWFLAINASLGRLWDLFAVDSPTLKHYLAISHPSPLDCPGQHPAAPTSPFEKPARSFVESLIVPASGLVATRPGECFTTVYKNTLAVMGFLHEGNHAATTRILDHFAAYLDSLITPFRGFTQGWNPCTGLPSNLN